MGNGSESGSVKSSTSSRRHELRRPPRPRLYIPPPPPGSRLSNAPVTATTLGATPSVYERRDSVFIFDQVDGLKGLAGSGLDVGEKSAFLLYNKLRVWSRKWFTHIFLTVVLLIYTFGGALIFQHIEGAQENKIKKELVDLRLNLTRELRNASLIIPKKFTIEEWEGEATKKIYQYNMKLQKIHEKNKLFVEATDRSWSFWKSVSFCCTIFTTIGYGHIYPVTNTGKALTIVYAIIGIPLFLIALTDFGKLFTRCIKFVWSFVRRVYYTGSCRRVRKTARVDDIFKGAQMVYEIATLRRPSMFVDPEAANQQTEPSNKDTDTPTTPAISNFEIDDEFNLPISLAIFILIVYIIFCALIYVVWLQWPFIDSFYFVFISMSTVGFGDLVPSDVLCMNVTMICIVFGLALTSMCINVVQAKLSDTFKEASTKIGAIIGLQVDEEGVINVPPATVEMPEVHGNVASEIEKMNDAENDASLRNE